jgi:hypothetical protein
VIPRAVLKARGLAAGQPLTLTTGADGKIVLTPKLNRIDGSVPTCALPQKDFATVGMLHSREQRQSKS